MTDPATEATTEPAPASAPAPPDEDTDRQGDRHPAWRRAAAAVLGAATGGAHDGVPF